MRTSTAIALFGALAASGVAGAAPTAYTSSIAFLASSPGPVSTVRFDDLASGEVITPGSTVGGIRFDHDLDGVDLIATDGTAAGAGVAFDSTSAPHFLGTSDLDVLIDGDDLLLGLSAARAVGLFVVTAETPGVTLFDGDIRFSAGGATASLDVDDVQATLADGSRVYFLGVIDADSTFGSASLGTFGAGGEFAFNIDDVVTAAPEPGVAAALAPGVLGLAAHRGRQRGHRSGRSQKEGPWRA